MPRKGERIRFSEWGTYTKIFTHNDRFPSTVLETMILKITRPKKGKKGKEKKGKGKCGCK